jgi:hypothetical protein
MKGAFLHSIGHWQSSVGSGGASHDRVHFGARCLRYLDGRVNRPAVCVRRRVVREKRRFVQTAGLDVLAAA